jgi:hypothetical protein
VPSLQSQKRMSAAVEHSPEPGANVFRGTFTEYVQAAADLLDLDLSYDVHAQTLYVMKKNSRAKIHRFTMTLQAFAQMTDQMWNAILMEVKNAKKPDDELPV